MNYTDIIILTMELSGTVAFAFSGALLAVRKEMDLLGVCVLGVTTAVGGGLIRDLVLGSIPPGMFLHPLYTLVALGVSLLLFFTLYVNRQLLQGRVGTAFDRIMLVFDTIGLGIFTVVGINTAATLQYRQKFLLIFVGVITGVGGGLLRDVMAQEKPYIFTKHVYASASIAGAVVCVYTRIPLGSLGSMIAGAAVVMLIRFLAARHRWNLPRINLR